ncbi:uncharacterized protein LOC131258345 [Magnolia sinica]|uniref:uncharacterized protein LOC131258345 n=1 Tax=Magnolia sinica TaxID=86752 RepID=UPI0026598D0D|nr:uncharacterized protein LOC131258345 [Magnolia sinica]
MLDCLSGGGFSSKCKSRIKVIRSRIDVIKRKKNATLKYLKNDIADLLQNGFDTNAYGRAGGLIQELNQSYCYELIEQFCGCILEQLSGMKKHRECPPESREAVSSLMFAAARFADLPELCDLRCIFRARYGNALESFVNQEFAEKIAPKSPSMEQKLQLMRDISREYSLNWDPKAFGEGNSNPPLSSSFDQPKMREPVYNGKDPTVFKLHKQEISSHQRQEVSPRSGHAARQEVKSDNKTNNIGHQSPAFDVSSGRKSAENLKPQSTDIMAPPYTRQEVKTHNKTLHLTNTNNNAHRSPAFDAMNGRESTENVKPRSNENMVPPYIKPKGSNYRSNYEDRCSGSDHNEPSPLPIVVRADLYCESVGTQEGTEDNSYKRHGPGRSNIRRDEIDHYQDNQVGDARHKPRSVRKQRNPPVHKNATAIDGNEYESRNRSGQRRQGTRHGILTYIDDDGVHDEEEMFMDELLMHYSKKPSSAYKSSTIRTGQKAPTHHVGDAGRSPLSQNRKGADSKHETGLPPSRALSLPELKAPPEVAKVPIRAASLQPETVNPNGRHVHPKLPDYDDVAAQLAALRVGGKVK